MKNLLPLKKMIELMKFGFALMKQVLFAKLSIMEREDILAYRKQTEIEEHNRSKMKRVQPMASILSEAYINIHPHR